MDDESSDTIWRSWLDENGWRLFAYANQLVPSQVDAEDLLQDVVIELWRKCATQVPDLALAYRKLRQRAIDAGRSRNRRSAREERWQSENLPPRTDFEFNMEKNQRSLRVLDALASLEACFREVVGLKLWGELTFEEIADVLEIPRNTAASRYRLALEKLRPLLETCKN